MLHSEIIRLFALNDTEGEGGGGTAAPPAPTPVETVEETVVRVGKSLDFSEETAPAALTVTEEATDGAGREDGAGDEAAAPQGDDGRSEPSASSDDGESGQVDAAAQEGEQPEAGSELEPEAAATEAEADPPPAEPEPEPEPEPAATPAETFMFHGRRPEDPAIEIDLSGLDKEQADSIRRTYNMGIRGSEAIEREQAVQADVQAVEQFIGALEADPVGTVMARVGDADVKTQLARHLLSDETVYNAVIEDLAKWDSDPNIREAASMRLQVERRDHSAAAQTRLNERAVARENIRQIEMRIRSMVPESMDREATQMFVDLAFDQVGQYVKQTGAASLHPDALPSVLRQTGLPKVFPGVDLDAVPTTPQSHPPAARASAPAAEPGQAGAVSTGQAFAARAQAKRVAAGVAPVGTPAPTQLRPPPGMGVEERIDWLEKQQISFTP